MEKNVMSILSDLKTGISNVTELASQAIEYSFRAAQTTIATDSVASKASLDAKGLVLERVSSGTSVIKKASPWRTVLEKDNYPLFSIGRPVKFNNFVDEYHRFGNYLKSKMSVIDLIPVDYGVDFQKLASIVSKNDTAESKADIANVYSFGYNNKINLYKRLCKHHGLPYIYSGIRLFTTDDTTSTDSIQISYRDNTFQGIVDKLSEPLSGFRDMAQSALGSNAKEFSDSVISASIEATENLSERFGDKWSNILSGIAAVAGDVVLKGNKMTFPKIWQNTSYMNMMSVNIRLISPYGHPKAIKEFILKPLSYLILLAAPQTINGVTYGGNIPITIKAYGMGQYILGAISSITLRRGGGESSYNLYKQPLTIDISIEFQTLFDAFAVADPSVNNINLGMDKDIFNNSFLSEPGALNLYDKSNNNQLMISLGTILTSLRPVKIVDMNINPQVYGNFDPPSRTDIPRQLPYTPVMGNLGSTISESVDKIDKFSQMIINAPKILEAALGNAVYNTAKGSVNTIANTAREWISKPLNVAETIRSTIMGNIF
jgi:hypothetical protein